MSDEQKMIVVVTNGFNDERSSVAWSVANGGVEIPVCPPCAGVRGYGQDDLIDGVTLAGSASMLARAREGAVTLGFRARGRRPRRRQRACHTRSLRDLAPSVVGRAQPRSSLRQSVLSSRSIAGPSSSTMAGL